MTTYSEIQRSLEVINTTYRNRIRRLEQAKKKEKEAVQKECAKIGHILQYRQVVGDGAFCSVCGAELDVDD